MMTQIEKLWNGIEEAKKYLEKAPTYTMAGAEFFDLYDRIEDDCSGTVMNSFRYGFIKGVR